MADKAFSLLLTGSQSRQQSFNHPTTRSREQNASLSYLRPPLDSPLHDHQWRSATHPSQLVNSGISNSIILCHRVLRREKNLG